MKKFIIILFSIIFVGCFTDESVSGSNSKLKCNYYTDSITSMIFSGNPYKENITGKVCLSSDNKSFVTIKNGLPHGKAKEYYESGALYIEVNYKNGKREGVAKEYSIIDDGKLSYKQNYKNGELVETTVYNYYESGALETERILKYGEQGGRTVRDYYESGTLKREENYKDLNQEEIGIITWYYESGVLSQVGNYKNGKQEGITKKYYKSGKLFAEINYKNDEPVSGKCANGRTWNNAELSNWDNGLSVDCGY